MRECVPTPVSSSIQQQSIEISSPSRSHAKTDYIAEPSTTKFDNIATPPCDENTSRSETVKIVRVPVSSSTFQFKTKYLTRNRVRGKVINPVHGKEKKSFHDKEKDSFHGKEKILVHGK